MITEKGDGEDGARGFLAKTLSSQRGWRAGLATERHG
jgi:hypothetical protein